MKTVKGERLGILDEVVTIEVFTESSRDTAGGSVGTWTTFASNVFCRADFRARGSEEIMLLGQMSPQRTVLFTFHYRTDITEDMRIVHNGSYYDIDSILPHEGRAFMTIEAIANES